jgi:hypothetical protein
MMENTVAVIALVLTACGEQSEGVRVAVPVQSVDLKLVEGFFRELGANPHTINPSSGTLSRAEKHVYQWIAGVIPEAMRTRYEIVEIRLSKATVGSPGAYELTRHIGKDLSKLSPDQPYIQLHVVHRRSDPELHGVIDLNPVELLSFWADGA